MTWKRKSGKSGTSLEDGNKTKVTVMFRGREMANRELGFQAIQKVIEELKGAGNY